MKSALKWLLFLPLFIFFFLFLKTPVFAADINQAQPPSNQYLTPKTNPDVPKDMHTYTQSVVIELMATAFCQLTGYDPLSTNHKCLGIDPTTNKIGFVENGGGLLSVTGSLITMTFQMPTSTSQYVNYLAGNFGISKKAYAANSCANDTDNGAGFCSIKPLTKMWVAMRNIVYLLFTIVFIVIGLAIMLRVHIDPRTVMSVENQIPKIIVGILLVTFSLAIAGFLIDIMYVSIYLIGNVLSNIAPSCTSPECIKLDYPSLATSGNPFGALDWRFAGDSANAIKNLIRDSLFPNYGSPQNIIDIIIKAIGGAIMDTVILAILWFLLIVAIIITFLRIWVTLVMAYIMILLDIVFAPFWFLAGLIPGGSLGVGAWFKDMLANLAVFPATIAMFALAAIFANLGVVSQASPDPLFTPPFTGGTNTLTLGRLIMFGFLFMTPQALSIMKAAFKAPKFNFGPVFAPAGAAAGVLKTGISSGATFSSSTEKEMKQSGWSRLGTKILSR